MDERRLFTDAYYSEHLKEFYNFVAFILGEIDKPGVNVASIQFQHNSNIYYNRVAFIRRLEKTFPSFEIEIGETDHGLYCIDVSWEKFVSKTFKLSNP